MSTQISKRALFSKKALSAGIGVSALALVAQRASADTNFTGFAFPATGAPTPRTMPDRIADVFNVKEFGAVGDGLADDTAKIQACIDAAFGPASSPHGGVYPRYTQNKAVFFPNGNYKISSPIVFTGVMGARIFGANRFSTFIENAAGGSVFSTNGFQYSRVEGMLLKTSGIGVCFDLNYDGRGTWSVSCQSNTFADMFFAGGEYGLRIASGLAPGAPGNAQGSENLVLNCFFSGQTKAGLCTFGGNACDNTIIGGNFQACAKGIWMGQGGFETIHGVSFQNSSGVDIQTESNVGEALSISGCRTESNNFLINNGGIPSVIAGCNQLGASLGFFAYCAGGMHEIIGCNSRGGQVVAKYWANLSIRSSTFGRSDWLTTEQMWGGGNSRVGSVEVVNVLTGGSIYGSAGNHIKSQRLYTNDRGTVITRNLEIEGTALTDGTVIYGNGYSTVTITIGSPAVFGVPNHGFAAGVPIVFFTDGVLPAGLRPGIVYYVISSGLSTNSFQVSNSVRGSAVNTAGLQSGTHSFRVARTFSVGDIVRNSAVAPGGSPGWICTTAGEAATGGTAVFKALPNVAV
jgi:hypothetical protein